MSDDMIERIARAIRHRAIERGFNIPTTLERHLAVAAIEAMLEPTNAMIVQGAEGGGVIKPP